MRTQRTSVTTTPRTILAALTCLTAAGSAYAQEPLTLRDMGMFYVGGEVRETAGFEQHVDQALVHFLVPDTEQPKAPVVMYPGLGLSSYIYLSTPDGREGWAQAFARSGDSAPTSTIPSTRDRRGSPWDHFEAPTCRLPASIPGTSARYGADGDSAMRRASRIPIRASRSTISISSTPRGRPAWGCRRRHGRCGRRRHGRCGRRRHGRCGRRRHGGSRRWAAAAMGAAVWVWVAAARQVQAARRPAAGCLP